SVLKTLRTRPSTVLLPPLKESRARPDAKLLPSISIRSTALSAAGRLPRRRHVRVLVVFSDGGGRADGHQRVGEQDRIPQGTGSHAGGLAGVRRVPGVRYDDDRTRRRGREVPDSPGGEHGRDQNDDQRALSGLET